MLTLRRVSTVYQYFHPLSSYQFRFKSKKSSDDDSKKNPSHFNEELLKFERKTSDNSRNVFKDRKGSTHDPRKARSITQEILSKEDGHQAKDLLRGMNTKSSNREKKSMEQRDRSSSHDKVNLAKPFDTKERRQKRDGESTGQKDKKLRPQVILDTDSSEVQILTRKVADALTPPNSPNESSNIEQELLDVLRGHRVVTKNERRMEKKPEHVETKESREKERSSRKKPTQTTSNVNVEKTTEAFSSLLRDFQLKPSTPSKSKDDDDLGLEDQRMTKSRFSDQKREGGEQRKPIRDAKRRQEFLRPHRLWSGEPLGIFTPIDVNEISSKISPIWEKYEQDELTRISTIPPRNAFEEMIQWTKDGIIWKFPIDNEQDVGPEADIPFYEHVLLERHLHGFPDSPLIRQFMELVCIGLGRNPYWTAEQKVEHITWFRNFFNDKLNVFNETVHTGAVKTSAPPPPSKPASTYKPKTPPPSATPPKVVPPVATPAAKAPTASKN